MDNTSIAEIQTVVKPQTPLSLQAQARIALFGGLTERKIEVVMAWLELAENGTYQDLDAVMPEPELWTWRRAIRQLAPRLFQVERSTGKVRMWPFMVAALNGVPSAVELVTKETVIGVNWDSAPVGEVA